jgi:hypothetical protein
MVGKAEGGSQKEPNSRLGIAFVGQVEIVFDSSLIAATKLPTSYRPIVKFHTRCETKS